MALVVLMFVVILLATFGLVIAMTRPSAQEKNRQRMALIHKLPKIRSGVPEREQLLK